MKARRRDGGAEGELEGQRRIDGTSRAALAEPPPTPNIARDGAGWLTFCDLLVQSLRELLNSNRELGSGWYDGSEWCSPRWGRHPRGASGRLRWLTHRTPT